MGSLRAVPLLHKVPPLKGAGTQVPNATLHLLASAGAHVPRAQNLNGDGKEEGNLLLWLPVLKHEAIRTTGYQTKLNSVIASEQPVKAQITTEDKIRKQENHDG